jgi:hypothetical protein
LGKFKEIRKKVEILIDVANNQFVKNPAIAWMLRLGYAIDQRNSETGWDGFPLKPFEFLGLLGNIKTQD